MVPETRVLLVADGEDLVMLPRTVFAWSTRVTDGRTELRWLRRAESIAAFARNNDCYGGTAIWCPRVQVSLNLENRDLDRRNLRSMLKIHAQLLQSLCLSRLISAQFILESCTVSQPEIAKKNPRSFKVVEFGGNREPVYDFRLVIKRPA